MKKYVISLFFIATTFFSGAQNIGIGTVTPSFKLDVRNGSINVDSVYRIGTKTVLATPETDNLFIDIDAAFLNVGIFGLWWSSTESIASNAWSRYLAYFDGIIYKMNFTKQVGSSVRCIKD